MSTKLAAMNRFKAWKTRNSAIGGWMQLQLLPDYNHFPPDQNATYSLSLWAQSAPGETLFNYRERQSYEIILHQLRSEDH
jgi:hypothetical protein